MRGFPVAGGLQHLTAATLGRPEWSTIEELQLWGPGVDDEMAGLHVQVIPVHMDEAPQLGQALWGAVMRSVGGRFYTPPPQ